MVANYYSQFGEDRILAEIFANELSGVCVEVGANDGVNDSMSLYFEQKGWDCVLVEPNPLLCRAMRQQRRGRVFECAVSSTSGSATLNVAEGDDRAHGVSAIGDSAAIQERIRAYGFSLRPIVVKTRTLDDILKEAGVDAPLSFVSIDVEGHELEVLRGFDLHLWSPAILIIEDNSNFSDRRVERHLKKHGYVPFKRTGVNDWYAHRRDKKLITLGSRTRWRRTALVARAKAVIRKIPGASSVRRWVRSIW